MQAPLVQQQEACAVYNVIEEMIQLPASKKICDTHHVDGEILTKVLENLKNSITQEALIQLAKCAKDGSAFAKWFVLLFYTISFALFFSQILQ